MKHQDNSTHNATNSLFDQALGYHAKNQIEQASQCYEEILEATAYAHSEALPIVYMNYGSLLRKIDVARAENLLAQGATRFPNHTGILNNLSNCLADQGKIIAAISLLAKVLEIDNKPEYRLQLAKLLLDLSYPCLSLECFRGGLHEYKLPDAIQYILNFALRSEDAQSKLKLLNLCSQVEEYFQGDHYQLAILYANMASTMIASTGPSGPEEPESVLNIYHKARNSFLQFVTKVGITSIKSSFLENWHSISWNVGIFLAKSSINEGWNLYEHGLLTPAKGPQKYQRALKKPFQSDEVSLWKGEDLKGKRILILGEQAIGDTLMFISIAPLLQELYGCDVSLYLPDRCAGLVGRAYPEICVFSDSASAPQLIATHYHYMIPSGSLPQFFLNDYQTYPEHKWDLRPGLTKSLDIKSSLPQDKILIGVSWQGGAGPDRLNKKSINLLKLVRMIERNKHAKDIVLVDLQYGHSYQIFRKVSNDSSLDFFSVEAITAMGDDFENWMELVNEVDLVISVANTTVHGAAALHKPTFCMLTESADWRWKYPKFHSECQWYRNVTAQYRYNEDWSTIEPFLQEWLCARYDQLASKQR